MARFREITPADVLEAIEIIDNPAQKLLELRRSRPYWGPWRLVFELAKRRVVPVPSASAAYRALVRAGMIDPSLRDRRSRRWKRWELGAAMELWQMDIVGGFALADGSSAKALSEIRVPHGLGCGYSVVRRLPACQSSSIPTESAATPKLASWGRSRRLRLSSAKPEKLANPSTLSQSWPACS